MTKIRASSWDMAVPPFHSSHKLFRFRVLWLLPAILIGSGYFATFSKLEGVEFEYLGLTMVSFLACYVLLSRLNRRPLQVTLPIWTILVIFLVAYYLKFYLVIVFPDIGSTANSLLSSLAFSSDSLISAYALTTYAFSVFCFTAWFLLRRPQTDRAEAKDSHGSSDPTEVVNQYRFAGFLLLLIVPILMVVTTYLMYDLNIAVMGAERVNLPFRLAGFIFYARFILIPALLLLFIWVGLQSGKRWQIALGLLLILLLGLGDTILRTSRGALAFLFLSLGFLFLSSNRQIRKFLSWFVIVGLFTVMLLHPIITQYRWLRIYRPQNIGQPLLEATETVLHDSSLWEILIAGGESILLRIPGMDMLLIITGLEIQPLGWHDAWVVLNEPRGVAGYFTVDIVGYKPYAINSVAPSMIGWFYLVGGKSLVILGMSGFTWVVLLLWRMLAQMRLRSLPVARTLFLIVVFGAATEGVLDDIFWTIAVTFFSILACEWLMQLSHGVATRYARTM